mmetsp:Transcript_2992/g.6777  ORF Transcript_2992/g.6777 Transcript_2992/m.6777 type:complete len:102 (-) Transcript_2992:1020-1325(-)
MPDESLFLFAQDFPALPGGKTAKKNDTAQDDKALVEPSWKTKIPVGRTNKVRPQKKHVHHHHRHNNDKNIECFWCQQRGHKIRHFPELLALPADVRRAVLG